VITLFSGDGPGHGTTIAVFGTDEDMSTLLPALRRLTRDARTAGTTKA
jgi:hypothetical protein